MSMLKQRIVNRAAGPDLTIIGTLNGPESLPMTRVTVKPGTLSYETLEYAITADGAPVIAVPSGGFGTLVTAGRS
jgi:hypothetical protein